MPDRSIFGELPASVAVVDMGPRDRLLVLVESRVSRDVIDRMAAATTKAGLKGAVICNYDGVDLVILREVEDA